MHGWWQKVAISAMVGWFSGVAQAADAPLKIVVVQPQEANKAGTYQSQARALEAALGKTASLVPLTDYLRAGKTLGLKPLALANDESAVSVGRVVGASHVLYLRPKSAPATSGRKGREEGVIVVLLVDTATGASTYDGRIPLVRGSAAQSKAAEQLVTALVAAAAAADTALATTTPPPDNVATPPAANAPAAQTKAPAAPAAAPAPAPAPVVVVEPLPPSEMGPPTPADGMGPVPPTPALVTPLPPPPPPVETDDGLSYFEAERRLPRGTEVALGILLYQRQALVGGELEYGPASTGGKAPLFARGMFDATIMPSRWHKHRTNALDGLLAFLHLELGPARTLRRDGNIATLGSYAFRVGGGYRAPLWKGPRAIATTLRLGFDQYLFASHAGIPFPAVGVRGFLVGLGLEVPLGTKHLALVADGALVPKAKPFSSARDLGTSSPRGTGGMVDAGVRLSFGPVDVRVLFAWERYSLGFAGTSHVVNLNTTFQDTTLIDQTRGAKVQLGLHF